jgi:DHA2 family multidrug resistance protein-like MFS transporter
VSAQLPSQLGDALLAMARGSFSHSMNVVALVGSLMLAGTAVAVTLVLRGTSKPAETQGAAAAELTAAEIS